MFDIISRLRPVVLDCFTKNANLYQYHPIAKSKEAYPDWWKSLKPIVDRAVPNCPINRPIATLRICSGLIDTYKNMLSIPLWCDIKVKTNGEGQMAWLCSTQDTNIENHIRPQFDHEEFDNLIHMKIMVPWILQEKFGVNFQLFQSDWNTPSNIFKYRVPSGVTNYKYQNAVHCNIFLPNVENDFDLKAGTTLLNLMPLTERKVIVKNHLIDSAEYLKKEQLSMYPNTFVARYKYLKNLIDKK